MTVLQHTFSFHLMEKTMREIVDVNTGQVKIGIEKIVLRSLAIGSCVVIAAYDPKKRLGAMAHVMLPGYSPQKSDPGEKTKYAADAIDYLLLQLTQAGTKIPNIVTFLVGAGNVLQKKDDTICKNNIRSITELLKEKQISVKAAVLGGTKRKSVFLDIDNAYISYTEGEGKETLLWKLPETSVQQYFENLR